MRATLACTSLLLAVGCAGTVHPPASPPNPVTVYLVDYGRHSSVVLPSGGGYTEWNFGDWNWFALGNTRLNNAILAMIHSPQATLGRREVPAQADDEQMKQTLDASRLLRFEVSAERAKALQDELDQRYKQHADTQVYSDYSHLNHVKDPEQYWWLHNCNHVTMHWLRELGCRVDGMGILSNFKLSGQDSNAATVNVQSTGGE